MRLLSEGAAMSLWLHVGIDASVIVWMGCLYVVFFIGEMLP